MINYTNIQRHDNIPFEDYLKLPGYSHSFLKRERNGVAEDLTITDNIRLGSMVDNILTEPHKVNMSSTLYPEARDIAGRVNALFGAMVTQFKKQVSFVGDLNYEGFTLRAKGRLDFLLEGHAVIDLKVTKSKEMHNLIDFMGYKNQLWHYCKLANVKTAYLMMYSVPLKKTEIVKIDCSATVNPFFQEKIIKFGKVKQVA